MKPVNVEQNSPEWHRIRCGVPTASEFSNLITSTGKPSASLKPYVCQIAANQFYGEPIDTFDGNRWTERGHELEPQARAYYEFMHAPVETIGFCLTDDESAGCSPDGLVGDDGMLQIKCLSAKHHVKTMAMEAAPSDYFIQTQGEMFVTGRKWNDLLFFHPELPPFVRRVEADEEFQGKLAEQIKVANEEINRLVAMLKAEAA